MAPERFMLAISRHTVSSLRPRILAISERENGMGKPQAPRSDPGVMSNMSEAIFAAALECPMTSISALLKAS